MQIVKFQNGKGVLKRNAILKQEKGNKRLGHYILMLIVSDLIHHIGLVAIPSVRYTILKRKLQTAPGFKVSSTHGTFIRW